MLSFSDPGPFHLVALLSPRVLESSTRFSTSSQQINEERGCGGSHRRFWEPGLEVVSIAPPTFHWPGLVTWSLLARGLGDVIWQCPQEEQSTQIIGRHQQLLSRMNWLILFNVFLYALRTEHIMAHSQIYTRFLASPWLFITGFCSQSCQASRGHFLQQGVGWGEWDGGVGGGVGGWGVALPLFCDLLSPGAVGRGLSSFAGASCLHHPPYNLTPVSQISLEKQLL